MDNFEFEYKKKKRLKRGPIYVLICVVSLVIGAISGYFYRGVRDIEILETKHNIYDQIGGKIEDDFLDTTKSEQSLQERILFGMVAALGDPHSAYLSRQQANELTTTINGSFQGIGVTFTSVDAGALILDVYKGTPAQKAGLMCGDMITHVQKTAVAGYSSDKIKEAIKGEAGTTVDLRILRNGKVMDVQAVRGSVETSVSYEVRTSQKQKIGYLRITTFGEGTHLLVEEALVHFQKNNVKNIVLDLRGNGGGYLDAARQILDLFIEEDEILVRVQKKDGKEEKHTASRRQKYQFEKGYILVDGSSASASEVMSGALREQLGYVLIGETTYGKGTVQTQYVLSDSSVLKLTYAKWLTPHGVCVNGEGLKPDYEVKAKSLNDFRIAEFSGPYQFDQVHNHILYMQEMLKELGYPVDRVDGYYSKGTKKAMEAFEKKYGLPVNGIYEDNDATMLLSALAYHIYQQLDDQVYLKVTEFVK